MTTPGSQSWVRAAFVGGLIAGTLDIFVAAAINHLSPTVILQAIASGVLGRPSFFDGALSVFLGLGLQWLMSLIIAAIYWAAALRLPALARRPFLWGALYGLVIFVVMNFVVVPLSAAWPKHHHPSFTAIVLNLAAMVLFGLIVAALPGLITRRATGGRGARL